jgi:endonuclease YncB( thermonuclease family)
MRLLVVIALCLFCCFDAAFGKQVRGIPQIVDEDTIYIGSTKVLFSSVDAPETEQVCLDTSGKNWSCGVEAKERLGAFSHNREWICELSGVDIYLRALSCTVDGESVSRWLVRNGWALAFRRYSIEYVADEDFAREHKHGVWSGAFIAPWDWRHRCASTVILGAIAVPVDAQGALFSHASTDRPPAANCLIKGNLSSVPQCIYHLPGGRFYDRLSMQPISSRRWFCTEAAAGCRRSKL